MRQSNTNPSPLNLPKDFDILLLRHTNIYVWKRPDVRRTAFYLRLRPTKDDQSMKKRTADYLAVEIGALDRKGLLLPGRVGYCDWIRDGHTAGSFVSQAEAERVLLTVAVQRGTKTEKVETAVSLDVSNCHFGGQRPWFLCPACRGRVAVLYFEEDFRCRHCLGLGYESQAQGHRMRAMRRAQKIRIRLGGSATFGQPIPDRPKGMHRKTYQRLREREALDQRQLLARPVAKETEVLNVEQMRTLEGERLNELRRCIYIELAGREVEIPDPLHRGQTKKVILKPTPRAVCRLIGSILSIDRHEARLYGLFEYPKSRIDVRSGVVNQPLTDEEIDVQLARLTPQEQAELMRLLAKMKGCPAEPSPSVI